MFKNRLVEPLKKGLNKGYNLFFLYGDCIDDCFFYSFYDGVLSSNQTYKRFFLDESKENDDNPIAKTYINITQNNIKCFQKSIDGYLDKTDDYFSITQNEDIFSDFNNNEIQTEEVKKIQKESENNNVKFQNNCARLKEIINKQNERTVIYFEKFEWLAGLYSSNKDGSLEYIKNIKELALEKNIIIVVSICDIELLKQYHFNIENSNCIYIGNPSAQEIKNTFLRQYMREVGKDIDISVDTIGKIEDISQSIAASNNSLRASMRIYDSIVRQREDYLIDKKDFEIAVEKILEEKVLLEEVVLDLDTKNGILSSIDSFLNSSDTKNYRKGLILTGPPGTGKTYLVKAIANERNCYFIAPTLSDLKGEYVGHSSAKVKRIFEQARANQPTILFIDEADTIFTDRNLAGASSDSYNVDMVNQFLVELDGMKTGNQKIFTIAATNRIGVMDNAIRSRLSEVINIGLPDKKNRKLLFHKKLLQHSFLFTGKSFSEEIAEKTENMSGRDIDNFVKKLSEKVKDTPFVKISNLEDNDETRKLFIEVLQKIEENLIDDMQRKIPVEIKSPQSIKTTYDEIIGYDEIKRKIKRQVGHLTASEKEKQKSEKYGIETTKGVLIYGPPGNAKTKIAEATAKEHNLYYIKVLSKDFASINMEQQLQNLQLIFDQTLRLSKMCSGVDGVLLFFDEFDSLASVNVLNPIIRGTILDYLSNEINGIRSKHGKIFLMAATNFYDVLDEALIRKGRIDEHMYMNNPSEEQGVKILKTCIENDKTIENPKSIVIEEIYNKLLEMIRNKRFENEYRKIGIQIELLQTEGDFSKAKLLEEFLNKQVKECRPSGADIIDLFKEIKNESYYLNNINDKKELFINEELINKVFGIKDN